jgi:hypothetical protein
VNRKLNGNPDFKASTGCLDEFKSRHCIRRIAVEGEKLNTNNVVVTEYLKQLNFEIKKRGLLNKQICNIYKIMIRHV